MPGIPKNYTFHDCRLVEITVRKISAPKFYYGNEVTLLIRYDESWDINPLLEFELTFRRVRGMRLLIDFVAKAMTGDAISWAGEVPLADHPELADPFEDWAQPIAPPNPDGGASRLFVVALIPTDGTIEIMAEEVEFQERTFQP